MPHSTKTEHKLLSSPADSITVRWLRFGYVNWDTIFEPLFKDEYLEAYQTYTRYLSDASSSPDLTLNPTLLVISPWDNLHSKKARTSNTWLFCVADGAHEMLDALVKKTEQGMLDYRMKRIAELRTERDEILGVVFAQEGEEDLGWQKGFGKVLRQTAVDVVLVDENSLLAGKDAFFIAV
ncbi:MAG: hypothetical protein M1827_006089 [Pycnora praestabilis]|nr:MAG: hypothetical protein M1827_006089 [Pycnora praestabilis]